MAIHKEVVGNELYVWCNGSLLYKRWIKQDYGMVMDRQPFTAKDTESFKNKCYDGVNNKNSSGYSTSYVSNPNMDQV